MFRLLKCKRGFTLVEIIVSIAILGIIVTPISTLFLSSVKNNANAKNRELANHLAQQYMEMAMMDPFRYIGSESKPIDEDNGDSYTVKVNAMDQINNYKLSETTGGTSLPDFDLVVDFSSTEMSSVVNGDTLEVIIGDTFVNVKKEELSIYNESYDLLNDIDIKVYCDNDVDIRFDVANNSDKRLNIYKVYSSTGENDIDVNTLAGEVYVYENIYDDTVGEGEKNRVYKIVVTVEKNNIELAKLVNFKTMD